MLGCRCDRTGSGEKIRHQLAADSRYSHVRVIINPPVGAKDYNEMLINKLALEREQKVKNNIISER